MMHALPARPARLLLLALFAAAAAAVALGSGSLDVAPARILAALAGHERDGMAEAVLQLRLPRVAAGLIVGGMLALAGALMQVLLRNPLAEPYVLGVSGGAAVFALLALAAGLGSAWVRIGACSGALLSVLLVFVLGRGPDWNPLRLLLTGVVLAAGWGALVSLLLVLSPAARVHGMLFWLMGDLGFAAASGWSAALLAGCLLVAFALARPLNLLAQGELPARALGVPVPALRATLYLMCALLTAGAVMQAGSIGFVGLVVPHLARLLLGADHRWLLPGAVLLGGGLLVLADTLARTLLAPQQLPVGVFTALIGVPLFLFLLQSAARRQQP